VALQGFPKTFVFPDEVSKNKRYTQIGNSVSVPISKMLANLVKIKLENEGITCMIK
jgi:site-specific DNA-cytosine methylase|tara:strand:- start:642 stop:809 length:168 start_codon:yes stop_codon:yes gene_type:complete